MFKKQLGTFRPRNLGGQSKQKMLEIISANELLGHAVF